MFVLLLIYFLFSCAYYVVIIFCAVKRIHDNGMNITPYTVYFTHCGRRNLLSRQFRKLQNSQWPQLLAWLLDLHPENFTMQVRTFYLAGKTLFVAVFEFILLFVHLINTLSASKIYFTHNHNDHS